MTDTDSNSPEANDTRSEKAAGSGRGQYVVVARRYRPQGFEDLVGQGLVSQALTNAIQTDRVGHAYLFTGARGVGKTSTARILSKALNCEQGPTPKPCHECDICQTIAAGEDVDVLEIDGASNRGIDEIRQLRSNVSVRPSRSRYKVYIIDEVHMLTKEAFNALLKTLEEPPEHVKFIFCTTDPEKIPITVLSRCQRFDFSPVQPQEIVERLQFIVQSEGASADAEALQLLARRAAGSMRDSQSLLEQLLSFTSGHISEADVHRMLGTAGNQRLLGVVESLSKRNAAGALTELDQAISQGVDAGQLAEQLLGCIRDLLALSVGAGEELMLHCSTGDAQQLQEIAARWGTQNLLAAAQILDQALARMRMVMHTRILLETALVRVAQLDNLQELSNLIAQVRAGSPPPEAGKKKIVAETSTDANAARLASKSASIPPKVAAVSREPADEPSTKTQETSAPADSPQPADEPSTDQADPSIVTEERAASVPSDAAGIWQAAIQKLDGMAADFASHFDSAANSAPNRLVVTFPAMYTSSKSFCQRPERHSEMEKLVSQVAGRKLKLEFAVRNDGPHKTPRAPAMSARQRERQIAQQPFVQRAAELFSASVTGVSSPKRTGE